MVDVNKDTTQLKSQVGKLPEELTIGIWEYFEDIWIEEGPLVVTTTNIAGDGLIWGHVHFGIWNSNKWTGVINNAFVLGHPLGGILGTSVLGSNASSPETIRVINPSNVWRERFRDNDFEYTNTTADWDTTNRWVIFDTAEILETEIIALNEETYSAGKVVLVGAGIANLTMELQFNGSTWETVLHNTPFTSPNASNSGIKLRLTAGTNPSNKFSLTFPMSFSGTQITKMTVEYS